MFLAPFLSNLYFYLPAFTILILIMTIPLLQIFPILKHKTADSFLLWPSLLFLFSGIGLLVSQSQIAYGYLVIDGFIPRGTVFFMTIAIIFSIENSALIGLILKYRKNALISHHQLL